jgi:hypothetical protein
MLPCGNPGPCIFPAYLPYLPAFAYKAECGFRPVAGGIIAIISNLITFEKTFFGFQPKKSVFAQKIA